MAVGLDLKEQISFRVTFANLWYGNGPFDRALRPKPDEEPDPHEGHPILYLELKGGHHKFHRLLGKRPATARIHRHPTGQERTGTGVLARGQLKLGEIEEEQGTRGYVDVVGFLPPESFDAVTSALISGGRDLLSRCRLQIGLKEEQEKIDFEAREGVLNQAMFLLEDLAMSFEIGEQYDDLADE